MAERATPPATYQALLALPDDIRGEVIAGEVLTSPAPLPIHGHAQRVLGGAIGGPFHDDDGRGGPGGWWIFPEVDVRLGPTTSSDPTSPAGGESGWPTPGASAPSTSCPTGSARSSRRATRATTA